MRSLFLEMACQESADDELEKAVQHSSIDSTDCIAAWARIFKFTPLASEEQ